MFLLTQRLIMKKFRKRPKILFPSSIGNYLFSGLPTFTKIAISPVERGCLAQFFFPLDRKGCIYCQ